MKRPIAAAAVGALAGVTAAGAVQLAYAYLPRAGRQFQSPPASPIEVLLTTAFAAGPGAFILAFALSFALRRRAEGGASRESILALGALGGLPAGMLNLLALMLLLGGASEIPTLFADPRGRMIAFEALAGGLALGLACAWSLTRRPQEGAG